MNNPLLSICIPTYNRATLLEQTIKSIVTQKTFQETEDVEIIISDNCSNDATKNISLVYKEMFGEKIKYFRNDSNIYDFNFEKALSYGKGIFLKLNNDTLKHKEGSLDKIITTIEENKLRKNIIFFTNANLSHKEPYLCEDLNSFVDNVSYYSGWIGGYGIWKEDYIKIVDYNKCTHLQLTQIDILFRLINSKRSVLVNNDKLFISIPPLTKGGYDLLKVFLDNYLFLLTEQVNNHTLLKKTFISEKRKLLLKFILPWLVGCKIYPKTYTFEVNNSFRKISHCYKDDIITIIRFIMQYYISLSYNFTKKVIKILIMKQKFLRLGA